MLLLMSYNIICDPQLFSLYQTSKLLKLLDQNLEGKNWGTREFHTMGIRALKPTCVQSPKFREKIPDFTQIVRNSTFCVQS